MEFPLSDFNLRDLARELYGRALDSEGSKQQLHERLLAARHVKAEAQAQGFIRPGRPPIAKFGTFVQPDDFAEVEAMTDEEYELFSKRTRWRLRRVHKIYTDHGESLEYYHPGILHQIDKTKTYALHMSEFWVRRDPYIHKIFVIFVMRTNGEENRLCYARSLAMQPGQDPNWNQLNRSLIKSEDIAIVLTNILMEIEKNVENFVAIITENNQISLQALREVKLINSQTLPEIVLDTCSLQKSFQAMFCAKSALCLLNTECEPFSESNYIQQLKRLSENYTQNVDAAALVRQYLDALPKVLQDMWQIQENQGKSILLSQLNNKRLNTYAAQVQNDLPPITFEECAAGGGLLQLIIFDALWCLCDEHELEAEGIEATLDTTLPKDWLPLFS